MILYKFVMELIRQSKGFVFDTLCASSFFITIRASCCTFLNYTKIILAASVLNSCIMCKWVSFLKYLLYSLVKYHVNSEFLW